VNVAGEAGTSHLFAVVAVAEKLLGEDVSNGSAKGVRSFGPNGTAQYIPLASPRLPAV
jgi:hypothetical protein